MTNWKANLKTADIIFGLLFIFLSAIAYYITTTWIPPILPGDPGAAFFPKIAIAIILFFSVVLLIQTLRTYHSNKKVNGGAGSIIEVDVVQFLIAIVCSGALVFCIAYLKFEIAGFAFLVTLLGMRTQRWIWAVSTSVIAVLIMYFVFVVVLKVRLPLLFLPEYLSIF